MDPAELNLLHYEYYHGLIDQEDLQERLQKDGDFLLRRTQDKDETRTFTLSINTNGELLDVHFYENADGTFKRDNENITSIEGFIEYHQRSEDSLISGRCVVLKRGVKHADWEIKHNQLTLGEELGRGKYGVVLGGLLAQTPKQKKRVAVKRLLETGNKQKINDFMSEARIVRKLKHRNVIELYGIAMTREPVMLVFELASDGCLLDFLKAWQRTKRAKWTMCVDIASGLTYIHDVGIVHCDVAARNCLVSNGVVKISDFGMSYRGLTKDVPKDEKIPFKWSAPEVWTQNSYTLKSDTWSYGVLSWEIFCDGAEPFHGMNMEAVKRVVTDGCRLPFLDNAPANFINLINDHVWDVDQRNRYSMKRVYELLKEMEEDNGQ